MAKQPAPPVWHQPIGHRRHRGEVVLFVDSEEREVERLINAWVETRLSHPATQSAGACVIVCEKRTFFFRLPNERVLIKHCQRRLFDERLISSLAAAAFGASASSG
jgi:hypothetical protein